MKHIAFFSLFIQAFVWACPPGTHAVTQTKTDYVCSPSYDYVCETQWTTDPATGEGKYDYVCEYQYVDKCEFVTSTYEDCVADIEPDPYPYFPDPDPYYPPTPASLYTIQAGQQVVTLYSTNLQIGTAIVSRIPRGTTLRVEKVHSTGWFWTTYGGVQGWVRVPHVYIKR